MIITQIVHRRRRRISVPFDTLLGLGLGQGFGDPLFDLSLQLCLDLNTPMPFLTRPPPPCVHSSEDHNRVSQYIVALHVPWPSASPGESPTSLLAPTSLNCDSCALLPPQTLCPPLPLIPRPDWRLLELGIAGGLRLRIVLLPWPRRPSSQCPVFPCSKCDGSMKYVHRACLAEWREKTTNPMNRQFCSECVYCPLAFRSLACPGPAPRRRRQGVPKVSGSLCLFCLEATSQSVVGRILDAERKREDAQRPGEDARRTGEDAGGRRMVRRGLGMMRRGPQGRGGESQPQSE